MKTDIKILPDTETEVELFLTVKDTEDDSESKRTISKEQAVLLFAAGLSSLGDNVDEDESCSSLTLLLDYPDNLTVQITTNETDFPIICGAEKTAEIILSGILCAVTEYADMILNTSKDPYGTTT